MASDSTGSKEGKGLSPHKKFLNKSDHPFNKGKKKDFSKEGMIKKFESKLDGAVEAGTITEDQKNAIIEKKTEMIEQFKDLKNLPPEEQKLEMMRIKDEFTVWAEENDIDLDALCKGYEKKGSGHFKNKGGSVEPSSLEAI